MKTILAVGLAVFLAIALVCPATPSAALAADPFVQYNAGDTGSNIQCWAYVDGSGNATGNMWNRVGEPADNEIGVLKITEASPVYKVEVYGNGCETPVTLTCNGVAKSVSVFHDAEPSGQEVITFDIASSTAVTMYTTEHNPAVNHGFRIEWIKLYCTVVEQPKVTALALPFAFLDTAFPVLVIVKNTSDSTIDDPQICIDAPGCILELPEDECVEPWFGIRANGYCFAIWFVSAAQEGDLAIEVCVVGEIAGGLVSGCDTVEVEVFD